jgi:hypothetical protein
VRTIGHWAFAYNLSLTNVTIGSGVSRIGQHAFWNCPLTAAYFTGNAPTADPSAFEDDNQVVIYYLPGTLGWGQTFAGRPTVLWNPSGLLAILTSGPSFGLSANGFGFTIIGPTNTLVVVEACTNLASPAWVRVSTNTLAQGISSFRDAAWTNYPARSYRVRSF